MYIIHKHIFY